MPGGQRPVERADVGQQAEGSHGEGGGVAEVGGVIEFGDAEGFAGDGAGVVAPVGGELAGIGFGGGAGG